MDVVPGDGDRCRPRAIRSLSHRFDSEEDLVIGCNHPPSSRERKLSLDVLGTDLVPHPFFISKREMNFTNSNATCVSENKGTQETYRKFPQFQQPQKNIY